MKLVYLLLYLSLLLASTKRVDVLLKALEKKDPDLIAKEFDDMLEVAYPKLKADRNLFKEVAQKLDEGKAVSLWARLRKDERPLYLHLLKEVHPAESIIGHLLSGFNNPNDKTEYFDLLSMIKCDDTKNALLEDAVKGLLEANQSAEVIHEFLREAQEKFGTKSISKALFYLYEFPKKETLNLLEWFRGHPEVKECYYREALKKLKDASHQKGNK